MNLRIHSCFLVVVSFFLVNCEGEWSDGDRSAAVACDLGDWSHGTPYKLAISSDEASLYVLDQYSTVYRLTRNEARTCAFEADPTFASFGALSLSGIIDDIALAGSFLYYSDGIGVLRYDDEDWSCDVSANSMAVQASSMVLAPKAGLSDYKFTATGCTKQSTSFSGVTRVHTVAANASMVVTAESVAGTSGSPERLSVYDRAGVVKYRTALSSLEESELHFCSATRIRLGSSYILLFDKECGYVGVFNYDGTLVHRLDLADLGIRSPADIAVAGDVLYILNGSTYNGLYRLDFATYSWAI